MFRAPRRKDTLPPSSRLANALAISNGLTANYRGLEENALARRTYDPLIELPPLPRANAKDKTKKLAPKAMTQASHAIPVGEASVKPSSESKPERRPDPREEQAKHQRGALRRGRAALTALARAFDDLGSTDLVAQALAELGARLDTFEPPLPRMCKEYRRARVLARQGLMGIHPEDVFRYCACPECYLLREDRGLPHPLAPKGGAE